MAKTFKLEVVTPDRQVIAEAVSMVTLPGLLGEFGVLPGHAAFLSALKKGKMKITRDGKAEFHLIGSGYAEVKGDAVIVLTESVEGIEGSELDRRQGTPDRRQAPRNQ
jgi:F-type H+-transporting ATPase subunit epsilon